MDLPGFLVADCRGDLSDMTLPVGCRHSADRPSEVVGGLWSRLLRGRYVASKLRPFRPSKVPMMMIVAKMTDPRKLITPDLRSPDSLPPGGGVRRGRRGLERSRTGCSRQSEILLSFWRRLPGEPLIPPGSAWQHPFRCGGPRAWCNASAASMSSQAGDRPPRSACIGSWGKLAFAEAHALVIELGERTARSRCGEQAAVELGGEGMDLAGDLGVGPQLDLLLDEVVVGFGLLEDRCAVLADHDEGREEDRL